MFDDDLSKTDFENIQRQQEADVANERLTEMLYRRDRKIREQESMIKRLLAERDAAVEEADLITRLQEGNLEPPKWLVSKKESSGEKRATVGLMLSDLHLDEVVLPAEMRGVNAFNREIAVIRFNRVIENTIELATDYFQGLSYDGCVVLWAGDVFSGIIHEELRETNDDTMFGSMLFWEPIVAGAFERLASAFGRLHVAVTVGNHGRQTIKWRAKGRARDSFEWHFAHTIAKHHFGNSETVTFDIPESYDTNIKVYNHTLHLEHGDNFRGGSGIAGAMSPLLLGVHRTTRQAISEERMFQYALGDGGGQGVITPYGLSPVDRMFDVMAIGHWHQFAVLPSKGLIINGSLKGYDEYARSKKFEPELAQQAMWLWTPEHGISFSAPIIAQKRLDEGW